MILFYLLITVMPLSRHQLWSRFVGELTIIKYLGVACLLYALAHLATRRTAAQLWETQGARWFVLLAVMSMTSFLTMGPQVPWETSPFMSYASFLLLFFVTLVVVDSLSRLRWVMLAAIGSVAFGSLYVLREFQTYPNLRPGSVTGDPNYFTVSALLCLPLALYLMHEQRPRWERLFCLACLVVTLLAVTLAASRGGFLALVIASSLVVWRSGRRVRSLALLFALFIPLSLVPSPSPLDRLVNPNHGDQEATERRTVLWKTGLRMVRENPLVGIGLGNFKPLVSQYAESDETVRGVAHNTYIEIAAELGLPGLLAFLAILIGSFRILENIRRRTLSSGPLLLHQAAQGIQVGLVAYAGASFFVSAQYQKMFWLMVFLSMCLPTIAADAASEGQKQPEWSRSRSPEEPVGKAMSHTLQQSRNGT